MPSPNRKPSGSTTAARPPSLSSLMISAMNRSAVSRVRRLAGKLFSMPSSSMPPKGGLVTMTSTRSLSAVVRVGAAQGVVVVDVGGRVDAVQDHVGDAQHVRQRLFLDAVDDSVAASLHHPWSSRSCSRLWSMVQVRKPPVPQAGSSTVSSSLGSTRLTMNWVTARGV